MLSTTDVAAVQAERDGQSRFRRFFDLELVACVESKLLRAQFRLESLRGLKPMRANGVAV
jgi:hypothetical protein